MHVCKTRIQPCNQTSNARYGNKDASKAKALHLTSVIIHRHLNSSTWQTAPQHSFKSKGMATPKNESGRQGPWTFITRDLEDRTGPARPWQVKTERVPRDRGRLPAPLVVGESRRPVPTAASVAAPDLGPLAWPASSLRRSPHGRAGSRHTAGRAVERDERDYQRSLSVCAR